MVTGVPIYAIVLDYVLGMVMWTLIGRFGMQLFLREDSNFFFSRFFIRVTDPLLRLFKPITPGFLIKPMVPLYVAWFFFMARFYVMPWLLGYSVMGMLSFPLEGQIAQGVYHLGNLLLGR
ncbi:YggT family protein [Luteimonas salinilitoris]|uniref:YggT family protein n=1 Tax=Luteimonas salinilitoris TaxID=3237697 RepID=A0ABV4HUB2_9GAMM